MRTRPRKRSAPLRLTSFAQDHATLTELQCRRQIIDLLAGHLARMPEAVAVSAVAVVRPMRQRYVQSGQGVATGSLKVSRFRDLRPPAAVRQGGPHLSR